MQGNTLTIDQVLQSKTYVKEGSSIGFLSPRAYIEPFLEKMKNTNAKFEVNVSERVANKEADSEVVNEAFGRVAIRAIFPNNFSGKDHNSVIGLVYSLDTQKPNMRIYSGHEAWACTNLAIFGARHIHSVELLQGVGSIYEKGLEFVEGMTEQLARFQLLYERMNDKIYKGDEINTTLGYLFREANRNKQIGTSAVMSAMHDLDDPKSKYAIREDKTSQWNMYSALTQYITDKVDILEKPSKTVLISKLFVSE